MKKAVTENQILALIRSGKNELHLSDDEILTPLAIDRIRHSNITVIRGGHEIQKAGNAGNKLIIGSDHTGVKAKKMLVDHLKKNNFDVLDIGTYSEDSVDYPDIAYNVASRVALNEFNFGILLDATGIPSAITANKIPGIRAATCYNEFSAKSSREHNNANVLVIGAKTLGDETIKSIADVWLKSEFLGDRHQRRLDKITMIENKYSKKS